MAQFAVISYQLQLSTSPLQQGVVPVEFVPRAFITIQTAQGNRTIQLPIHNAAEFMAICALIQSPGRLVFDDAQETLEKLQP